MNPPNPPRKNANLFDNIDYLVKAALFLIAEGLNTHHFQEQIMATVQELEQKLDAIDAALTGEDGVFENLAGDLSGLKTEIQALKDQIAAGTPVTQEQLDGLVTKADGIATKASANAQKLADLAASTP